MSQIVCKVCRGSKKVMGGGMMITDCLPCDKTGFVHDKPIATSISETVTDNIPDPMHRHFSKSFVHIEPIDEEIINDVSVVNHRKRGRPTSVKKG
jgi:hypothetical protein